MTEKEFQLLKLTFSRIARHRGKLPDSAFVIRTQSEPRYVLRSAIQYIEPGKWERWGIQNHPAKEIVESWSTLMGWLRPLIGDRTAIEVYPRDDDVVNTAPIRWFWVCPTAQPNEWKLPTVQQIS